MIVLIELWQIEAQIRIADAVVEVTHLWRRVKIEIFTLTDQDGACLNSRLTWLLFIVFKFARYLGDRSSLLGDWAPSKLS